MKNIELMMCVSSLKSFQTEFVDETLHLKLILPT